MAMDEKTAAVVNDDAEGGGVVKVARGTRDMMPEQMIIRELAMSTIKQVFLRHGGAQIDTPVFELQEILLGKYGDDNSKLIYNLADQGGERLALRYDLTVPFARFMGCHKEVGNIKRFQLGKVYRRDNPVMNKGRFREFYQCDFDIAGYDNAVPMLPDAECLKILQEILLELNVGSYIIKINHRQLLTAILQVAGVADDKVVCTCSAIDKLDKQDWKTIKHELIYKKNLSEKSVDIIGRYVSLRGDVRLVLNQLQKDTVLSSNKDALASLQDMQNLAGFLAVWGVIDSVRFDLSLARGLDYYTGIIYEAILADNSLGLGSIAAGGRYDGLVGKFSGKHVPAVGLSIGLERILDLLEFNARQKTDFVSRRSLTQVMVCSAGKNMLIAKMDIVAELWKAGIAAEFSYSVDPKPKTQAADAAHDNIPVTVWIGSTEVKQGTITVKDMLKKTTETISKTQLVQTIKQMLSSSQATETKSVAAIAVATK